MPITIDITVTQSDIDAHWKHFGDPGNCPIYHACQRQFPESRIIVSEHDIDMDGQPWVFDERGRSFSYALAMMLTSNGERAAKPCSFTATARQLMPKDILELTDGNLYQKEELVV